MAPSHQLRYGIDPLARPPDRLVYEFPVGGVIKGCKAQMDRTHFQGPDSLQEAFLKGPSYAHGLAGGLHLGPQSPVRIGELVEGKAGHLGDHVVQGRLKAGRGIGQGDLLQGKAHADLGGDSGNGIAGGLGGQGRGPGYPGVDLDQVILKGERIQGELDIAASLHLQGPDHLQGRVPQHVVFLIRQGLGGAYHDGVSRMDAHGIQVLHTADRDGRV